MAVPIAPPPPPPHAYVVDYRPLDACATPTCTLRSRNLLGYANETQFDGDPGAYVTLGKGADNEEFFRRGVLLRPNEAFTFTLPDSDAESELDTYISANAGDTDFHARIEVDALLGALPPRRLASTEVTGHTARFAAVDAQTLGHLGKFAKHLRLPLPSRSRQTLRVTIRNVGTTKAALSSPVVMKRVDGRGPRHAVFALFDAVAFHLMDAMLRGNTGDAKTEWLGKLVAERGIYFPRGQSPSQATASFAARFFGGEYWGHAGWPAMVGTGAVDNALPASAKSPIARLAEQGMFTELVSSNFLMLPTLAPLGFDGGIQTEVASHSEGLARYVAEWATEHPRDDAMFLVWNSQTHMPYPPGRQGSPAPAPPSLSPARTNTEISNDIWRNLLEGVDYLNDELTALRTAAPDGDRIIYITADHSRGISKKFLTRPYRTVANGLGIGLSHGCTNTAEEMNVPFTVIFDGPGRPQVTPRVVEEPVSSFAAWRAVEQRFGVSLGLPPTTVFTDPVFSPEKRASAWDDRVLLSVGLITSMRAVRGDLAYGFFMPKPTVANVWSLPFAEQQLLLGTPTRAGSVLSEELYDDAKDPYEYDNVASRRFDDLLSMRREVVDFVSAHYDPPGHPRKVYTLVLPRVMNLRIRAPHPFTAVVNGAPVPSVDRTVATVLTNAVELVETEAPLGVIEVLPIEGGAPFTLTCATSGLPLDTLSVDRPRFNLSVAVENCPLPEGRRDTPRAEQILFSSRRATPADGVVQTNAGASAGGSGQTAGSDEFLAGMKRWGYVRDIDKDKK